MGVPAIAARLGVEVVGETIKGVFGLASATVSAAGEAAKGIGSAVGGALEGAMSPAPVTVVNNVGMAGEAAKSKVTGGGTMPMTPKKSAKPVANAKMPTEKLLVIAVNYLSSIEKTLEAQLNFERVAAAQQATAEREAAIEGDAAQTASPYRSLGEKLGAVKDNAAGRAGTMAKILLGGAALGTFGLLGLGEMDTAELDRLKSNWAEFQNQWKWLFDTIGKVYDFLGPDALAFGSLGYFIGGWRGGLIGLVAGKVYDLTGSEEIAAVAGGAAGLLTFKTGRRLAGNALRGAARFAAANPAAVAAGGATLATFYSVDQIFKGIQSDVNTTAEKYEQSFGLYVQERSEGGWERKKYKIIMRDRNINFYNVPAKEIHGDNHKESERFYFWNRVHLAATDRSTGPAAEQWLKTKGQAWLDARYPLTANASPVSNVVTPDASRSGTIAGAPVADATSLANLPAIPADIEKILATIRTKESGGNYGAQNPSSTASGAYQFIDGTWQALTSKYGIGTEYSKAKLAPPEIQDAVAAKYTQEILQQAGGDVTKVPVAWYTGNIQGKSDAVSQSEVASYQKDWMNIYTGGQYAGSSYDLQGGGSGGGMLSAAWDLGEGAMEAIGNILKAAIDTKNMTTVALGSQMSGTTTASSSDMPQATSAGGGAASPITPETNTTTKALTDISTQLQNSVDLGLAEKTQTNIAQESTGQMSIRNANASNDGKLECLDPNFPGSGGVEAYLQYYRMAA